MGGSELKYNHVSVSSGEGSRVHYVHGYHCTGL